MTIEIFSHTQVWGTGGPEFKSRRSDQDSLKFQNTLIGNVMGTVAILSVSEMRLP